MRKVNRMIPLVACCYLLTTMNASCGCSNLFRDPEGELFAYLAEKYPDDKFTKIRDAGGGIEFHYDYGMYVKSEKYPDAQIYVSHVPRNGEQFIFDNYMAYYFEEEAQEYIQQIVDEIFGECKVFSDVNISGVIDPAITKESSVLDFLRNSGGFYVRCFLSPEKYPDDIETAAEVLCERVSSERLNCYLTVRFFNSQVYYNGFDTCVYNDVYHGNIPWYNNEIYRSYILNSFTVRYMQDEDKINISWWEES